MDRIELVEALRAAGVPDGEYLIPGGPASGGPRADAYYVLREESGAYLVSLWERGAEETAARFASEDEACRYLYGRLAQRAPAPPPDSAQIIEDLMARREEIQREARDQYDQARRHERG
ncbi:hypothetical protein [Saccharopolyspora oryzae]|uniref:Uncharacterized protein n=1 Tax=Saccharopolyspora oryzae TaxID=2997343 RepID=A0ABT4V6P7_9PSEU|nr:hypothetical protein [Saccharopolyspora oryzae]MDA3629647.1 hypothetical protein [Saccharopolyspora oryzae]